MKNEVKKGQVKFDLFNEYYSYKMQYHNAINLLLKSGDLSNYIYPITLLIYQLIENDLKFFIVEPHISGMSFKDFKIENTHNLEMIFKKEELRKYYDEIDICSEIFHEYENCILFFFKLLGEDTFLKSRYPFEKEINEITKKEFVDFENLRYNWTNYCFINTKIVFIYIAYCSSNSILYLKNVNVIRDSNDENLYIDSIVNETFSEYENSIFVDQKEFFKDLIFKFVERNKYYDVNYVQ